MKAFDDYETLISAEREVRDNYMLLASCVLPRPIAFVSTVSAVGVANLAPFSFFNAAGAKPPTVLFCPAVTRDGTEKDTLRNIRETGEFVVNVVPYAIRDGMNETAFAFPPDVSEFDTAGFSMLSSRYVKPARVAESPIHMECKLTQIVPIGSGPQSSSICIGEVLCFHTARDVLASDGNLDVEKLDLVGRLGGDGYSTTRDRFSLRRPSGKSAPESNRG